MINKDDILSDISMLVEGGVFSVEDGEYYKSVLEQETPQEVAEKILVALEQNKDVEAENMKGVVATILEMRTNADQNGDDSLRVEADNMEIDLKERMSRYEQQTNTLEKKYQEVMAPKLKELDIEEQRKKIMEM